MLPRYRYSKDGENIDNITDRALKQFRHWRVKWQLRPGSGPPDFPSSWRKFIA